MQRKPWTQRRNRRRPERYRDELPQPLPSLPPENLGQPVPLSDTQTLPISSGQSCEDAEPLETPRNIFGLYRRYYATKIPSYDPEEHTSLQDMSNIPAYTALPSSASQTFYPYPNRSAFRLGDWFWNGGVQKSQASFDELMKIIGDPRFQPEDIQGVKWDHINKELAADDEREWMDEDAGWVRTPVAISVPYQPRRGVPPEPQAGPKNYVVEGFYHRSLVSVIREKLSSLTDCNLFRFEPNELLWKRGNHPDGVRIQGELYNSPTFVNVHRELQNSPSEPGCDLPKCVAALMFWSDATHLTAFGNTKLWPLYMFFGNESKYRRCKPSHHLCEHIAYFQTASQLSFDNILHRIPYLTTLTAASRCVQRFCC